MNKVVTRQPNALSWVWISVLIIIVDQVTKFFAVYYLPFSKPLTVLPFFNLMLLYNTGAAFSMLGHAGEWASWLFAGLAVIISIVILSWLYRTPKANAFLGAALALILGGAIGNLIDRISHGFVIDFIQLHLNQFYWPAFNIADSAICVGAVMVAIEILFRHKKSNVDGK